MKRTSVLTVPLMLVAFVVSGQAITSTLQGQGKAKVVGTFHAQDAYNNNRDVTVTVWAYPTGIIYLDAGKYPYILTTQDRDTFIPLAQQAVHYCQVAKDNSTTIDFTKDIGNVTTEDGAMIVVRFVTHGWEHSGVELRIYHAGRNADLFVTTQDVADMAKALSAVTDYSTDYNRQVALFK